MRSLAGGGLRPGPSRDPQRALPAEPEALGALLASLEPRLRAVALRLTRDPATADDVVQSAFEKALRHRHRFRGEARVSTWLHRIVANEALMWLRRQRRRTSRVRSLDEGAEERIVDPRPDADARVARSQDLDRMWEALARLPADERRVLVEGVLAGRSYRDLGTAHGEHPAALKSRAFRARRRLRAALLDPV